MASNPEEAAYHEAGHCYVARWIVGRVVEGIVIYEERDGWGGQTDIVPNHLNEIGWTTIEVAGVVAEARADANRRLALGVRLVIADQFVRQVKQYVDDVLQADAEKRPIGPRQINFRTSDGNEAVSSMSPDDVRRMTPPYRDEFYLRLCLESMEESCREPYHWVQIEALARGVLAAKGFRLDRREIETILRLR